MLAGNQDLINFVGAQSSFSHNYHNFSKFCVTFKNFGHFHNESEWAVGILCAQLLLQFYSDSLETLQML